MGAVVVLWMFPQPRNLGAHVAPRGRHPGQFQQSGWNGQSGLRRQRCCEQRARSPVPSPGTQAGSQVLHKSCLISSRRTPARWAGAVLWVHLHASQGSSASALRLLRRGTGSTGDASGERQQPLRLIPAWEVSLLCHPPPQEDATAQHGGSGAQRMRDLFS